MLNTKKQISYIQIIDNLINQKVSSDELNLIRELKSELVLKLRDMINELYSRIEAIEGNSNHIGVPLSKCNLDYDNYIEQVNNAVNYYQNKSKIDDQFKNLPLHKSLVDWFADAENIPNTVKAKASIKIMPSTIYPKTCERLIALNPYSNSVNEIVYYDGKDWRNNKTNEIYPVRQWIKIDIE